MRDSDFYLSPCGRFIIKREDSYYWNDCSVVYFAEFESNLCMSSSKFYIIFGIWIKLD